MWRIDLLLCSVSSWHHLAPAAATPSLPAAAQLETIGLSRFQNFWSDVYDFTPGTGHWDFLPLVSSQDTLLLAAYADLHQHIVRHPQQVTKPAMPVEVRHVLVLA